MTIYDYPWEIESEKEMRKNVNLWLDALRSGQYKQGKIKLNFNNQYFCAIGVLCEIFYCKYGIKKRYIEFLMAYSYDGDYQRLPNKLNRKVGLSVFGEVRLANVNDIDSLSFNEIADLIERDWNSIFTHTKE